MCYIIFPVQMTGRRGRVVRRPDGIVRYESRAEQGLTIDHINLKEKDRFMSGEKVKINICHWQNSLYHFTMNNSITLIYCTLLLTTFIPSWWPLSQRLLALGSPSRQTSEWRTRGGESTWLWNCLGVQTGPFSSLVSNVMFGACHRKSWKQLWTSLKFG